MIQYACYPEHCTVIIPNLDITSIFTSCTSYNLLNQVTNLNQLAVFPISRYQTVPAPVSMLRWNLFEMLLGLITFISFKKHQNKKKSLYTFSKISKSVKKKPQRNVILCYSYCNTDKLIVSILRNLTIKPYGKKMSFLVTRNMSLNYHNKL